jgi:3-deoxy-7-phosphoheptulonate synthase
MSRSRERPAPGAGKARRERCDADACPAHGPGLARGPAVGWGDVPVAGEGPVLASRHEHPAPTLVDLGDGVVVGEGRFTIMAGPCAVESEAQLMRVAEVVAGEGVRVLRGGAWKPRTSPYSFQGMGEKALALLARVARRFGLKVVTEVLSPEDVDLVADHCDLLQIGSRSMGNLSTLHRVGRLGKPLLLKRNMGATVAEWLQAAEVVLAEGNPNVILCERGVVHFDPWTRYCLDLAVVPLLGRLTHLPVVVDPSHATGRRDLVPALCRAAVAVGSQGLLVEVSPDPQSARCDGLQSLDFESFRRMVAEVRALARVVGASV